MNKEKLYEAVELAEKHQLFRLDKNFNERLAALIAEVRATQPPQDERGQGLSHEFAVRLSEYGVAMAHRQGEKARVLAEVLQSMFDAEPAQPVALSTLTQWIEEALSYVGGETWSPSLEREGRELLAALAASATVQQATAMKNFSVSKEWLAEKLETHDDADAAAGQTNPQAPCKTYPGCNGSNCLGCGEPTPPQPVAAEVATAPKLLLERAAQMCEWYAEFIRDNVMSQDIERHPYLPELDGVAVDLRALSGTGSDESGENCNG